jgi:MFS family permease
LTSPTESASASSIPDQDNPAPVSHFVTAWFLRTFESLGSGQYRLLWIGLLLMMAAMNMQMLARGYLAWELTKSAAMVGYVGAGFAPPILILSLFGGAVADRFNKKRMIQAGQFGMGTLSVVIAISITTETITVWHLIGASVIQGILFAFMMPARQVIIPQLVEKHQLSNAVALNASGMSLMTLLAPVIAGFIYGRYGAGPAYFVISGLNFAAVSLTTMLRPVNTTYNPPKKKIFGDVREGLRYSWSNKTVLMLLIVALSTTVLAMPLRTLLPVQIEEVFNRDVESLGLLMLMIGAGALVGSLAIAGLTTGQHRGLVLLGTTLLSGVAVLMAGLNTSYFVALGIMVLIGLGDAGRRSLNASLIMEEADQDHRGRVMGLYMMNFGMIPIGTIPLAYVSDAFGIRWAFALAGALLILAAIALTLLTARVRRL